MRNEIIAGITTFCTMAYIVIVNPILLSKAGMDSNAVFTATCISAAVGCFLMGVFANYPIALAPSMSLNTYFTFFVVQQLHYPWQTALGIVFIAGLLFALLTLTQFRQWLIYCMPHTLKMAITAGIGLFLIAIVFKSLDVHLASCYTNKKLALCLLGVFFIFLLERKRIIGAILLGMLAITLVGSFFDPISLKSIASLPPSIEPTLFKLQLPHLTDLQSSVVILIFLFVALFDNTGTTIAVLQQAKIMPKENEKTRLGKALFADSLASMLGALFGTSTTGSYIESVAGVRAGGRTGMTAVIVGILFLCALFFAPLAKAIPDYAAATALMYVGFYMLKNLSQLSWKDPTEYLPALACTLAIPVTFSIASGVSIGFISYIILKTISGKFKQIPVGLWLISGVCLIYLFNF